MYPAQLHYNDTFHIKVLFNFIMYILTSKCAFSSTTATKFSQLAHDS